MGVSGVRKKVESWMQREGLLEPGDFVILAVSGGADSVCLLHLFAAMRADWMLKLLVIHVHHGLRGAEADRDAAFVEQEAAKLGIRYITERRDVGTEAVRRGKSCEETGREIRYEIFLNYAQEWESEDADAMQKKVKIAVAHHQEDQAETILHNLFRGSGLKGLGGMSAVRGRIIRPLLCLEKGEILAYLSENQLSYCEDSTNQTSEYTRNRLRNELIPQIRREVNERAVEHIVEAGKRMRQADAYFEKLAQEIWTEHGRRDDALLHGRFGICRSALMQYPQIVQAYVVRHILAQVSHSLRDITSEHVEQVLALLTKETGKQSNLPYGLLAWIEYDLLWISNLDSEVSVDNTHRPSLIMNKIPYEKQQEIPQNRYTKWFDYDKIKDTLSVRTRQTGDYITLKNGKRKTVKTYMIDEKIPRAERDEILLLAEGHHVLWIVGWRISEYYKVTEDTNYVLEVRADGGKEDG